MAGKLTPKQRAFIEEYPVDLNATAAAIRAGYSKKTAEQQGYQLLQKTSVRGAIDKALAERSKRTGIKADQVLEELARLGFCNMLDYIRITPDGDAVIDLTALTREQATAIGELTSEVFMDGKGEDAERVKRVKFKLGDKIRPLELLGKHLGLFPSRHEHTGKDGGPIETKDLTDDERSRRLTAILELGAKSRT